VDGWAHHHLATALERFFTPWHAAFSSGFLAVAGVTAGALLANRARGLPWARALPPGYGLSAVGAAVFAASGVGDLIWHRLFGLEVRMEALLSPTHIGLTLGVGLLVSGPWRAAWRRADGAEPPTWAAAGPMVLSLAWLLSTGTCWTMFAHPLSRPWAALGNRPTALVWPLVAPTPRLLTQDGGVSSLDVAQMLGIDDVLRHTALLMGVVGLTLRRWGWRLPRGSLTLVFTRNASLMGLMRDQQGLIPVAVLAGLGADGLLRRLKPSMSRVSALRLFAAGVPLLWYSMYFLALHLTHGIWWTVHVWAGVIGVAGLVGWLVSSLVVPPPGPTAEHGS
jgi:hypothetical protein